MFFLPKGMELVVLANSPFCQPDTGFMDNVLKAIIDNIESTLFKLTIAAFSAIAAFALFRKARTLGHKR